MRPEHAVQRRYRLCGWQSAEDSVRNATLEASGVLPCGIELRLRGVGSSGCGRHRRCAGVFPHALEILGILPGRHPANESHGPLAGGARHCGPLTLGAVLGRIGRLAGLRRDFGDGFPGAGVGQDAEVPDAVEAAGQRVHQEAADELHGRQRHDAVFGPVRPLGLRLSESEPDRLAVEGGDAAVADGHPMGVARQILEQVVGALERWFGVDVPLGAAGLGQQRLERLVAFQRRGFSLELQLAVSPGLLQSFKEEPAEQPRQHLDRREEGVAALPPAAGADVEAAVGHQQVDVRMELQALVPGVQHRGGADAGAEAFGIGGDGQRGLGAALHQQVEHHPAVADGEPREAARQREDQMEIRRRQQLGALPGQPAVRGRALAVRAVAVAARVVDHMTGVTVPAVVAAHPHRFGAAAADRMQHLARGGAQPLAVPVQEPVAGPAEDLRRAGTRPRHRQRLSRSAGWSSPRNIAAVVRA